MRKSFQFKTLFLSMAVASSVLVSVAPAISYADVSYNASVSNMYLWRGINISSPNPVVSGGADVSADSGLYAGVWASSEGYFDNSSETDLYFGYSPTFGDVGLTIGYAAYLYPGASKEMFTSVYDSSGKGSMLSDYVLGASYKDLSLTGYFNTERNDSGNNIYATLDYSIGKFGLHGGVNMNDDSAAEYTEYNVSYAATNNLSFTVSKAQGDGAIAIAGDGAENPLVKVTYNFTF